MRYFYICCVYLGFIFLYVSQRLELTACMGSTYQLQLWSCDGEEVDQALCKQQ